MYVDVTLADNVVELTIKDEGIGIENVDEARQPLFTTKPELERSGMGFTIMENFMDEMKIISHKGEGTIVTLKKHVTNSKAICN